MDVVLMSDTHLQHRRIPIHVPDGDMVVHAGDALNAGRTLDEVRDFVYWFNSLPHKHKVYCPGNHDWVFDPSYNVAKRLAALQMLRDAGIVYLQDEEVTIGGLRIYGSPWQPEFYDWAFNLPRGGYELQGRWSMIPTGLDILITHGPPHGVLDRNYGDERCGCELLWERIQVVRPKVHVFGHIHSGYGTRQLGDTLFVNAAVCDERYWPGNKPHVVTLG